MYTKITQCRICGNTNLEPVLDLGVQALTGVFPKSKEQYVTRGPLRLVKCHGSDDVCGLIQLEHSYSLDEMYGENYGYRSGLNASMVMHLQSKVQRIQGMVDFEDHDIVLDIGSNDGTTLGFYPEQLIRIGMDPTADKFRKYYKPEIRVIADFFSVEKFFQASNSAKAKVVTSFSMFYDLESPQNFVNEISRILHPEGVWIFEQSYMPSMLKTKSFDTVCHEHLEYYSIKQIDWLLKQANLKIIDIEFNDINGGSFSISAAHRDSSHAGFDRLDNLLLQEQPFNTVDALRKFEQDTQHARDELVTFVKSCTRDGKKVGCLGASTKGNVLLQYCGFTESEIWAVGEVNPEKFNCFTPQTLIPIFPEATVIEKSDYLIVLPWHFRTFFDKKMPELKNKLVYPLPELSIQYKR